MSRRDAPKRSVARWVRVIALENRNEMPAHEFEIEEAEVEGIEIPAGSARTGSWARIM